MKPEEKLKKLINTSDLTTNLRTKERILGEALENLRNMEQKKTQSAQPEPNIGRAIMKNKTIRFVAAAVIILACVIGLSLWRTTGSGIALADVLTRIEQVTGYTYQMKSIAYDKEQQGTETTTATILVSKEADLKMTITKVDSNNFQKPPDWGSFTVGIEWYLLPKRSNKT